MNREIPFLIQYSRICPKCSKIIIYNCKNYYMSRASYVRALRKNSTCLSCANKYVSPERRLVISKWARSNFGEKASNWQGGINKINNTIRNLVKYDEWRKACFERDNYTCQECGTFGGKLQVHHINRLSTIIKMNKIKTVKDAFNCSAIWNLNNGKTLCLSCHDKYPKRTKNFGKL